MADKTVYIPSGSPDNVNYVPGQAPGEVGQRYNHLGDRSYQIVTLDSGATALTPVGAVAANQAAYWKDKASKVVTNDARFAQGGTALGFPNMIAGVFRSAVTAGNITHVLQRGTNIPVKDGGNTFAAGELVFGEADATAAAFDRVAVGTMPGYKVVGVARGVAAAGLVNVDLDIPLA